MYQVLHHFQYPMEYDTTVGRIAGYEYYDYLTQLTTGASPSVDSAVVGVDYLVDVRFQTSNANVGSWTYNLGDNTFIYLSATNNFASGDDVRLQFQNKATTPVNVQVSGTWATH